MVHGRGARVWGWIPVEGYVADNLEGRFHGGLVEISNSGARLYLDRQYSPGDRIPLGLRVAGERTSSLLRLPCRVAWTRRDEPGNVEAFDARMKFLPECARRGIKPEAARYGWLCGVEFEKDVDPEAIRMIDAILEQQGDKPGRHGSKMCRPLAPSERF